MPNKGRQHKGRTPRGGTSRLPVCVTPARDPPTLDYKMPRRVRARLIPLTITTDGEASWTRDELLAQITTQTGTTFGGLLVEEVCAWGHPGVDGGSSSSSLVSVNDTATGVGSRDTGTLSDRPRAGLRWPPSAQTVPAADAVTFRVTSQLISNGGQDATPGWDATTVVLTAMCW